ncbi:MAG: diguanylate cyclase [Erysipelotrichaceae bacterium]
MQSIIVPLIASFFYAILFLALTAAKKNKMLHIFMTMIFFFLIWTVGSAMMRASAYPGVIFWCKASIFGMFGIPLLYYSFIGEFLNNRGQLQLNIFLGLFILSSFLLFNDNLLSNPQIINANGYAKFVYSTNFWMIIPIIYVILVAVSILKKIFQSIKAKERNAEDYYPIIAGILILTLGTLLSTIPAIGKYPIDTMCGIFNAICLFYTLYKRRLIKMTMVLSRGSTYILTGLIIMFFSINFINPIEQLFKNLFPTLSNYIITMVVVVFSFFICLVFFTLKHLIDLIFAKDEQRKAIILRNYSAHIASYLDLEQVCKELIGVVSEDVQVQSITICLKNEANNCFQSIYSSFALQDQNFSIAVDNPCIAYLIQNKKTITMKDFERNILYKSMWKKEKDVFDQMKVDCFVPLLSENNLIGIIMLSGRNKNYSLYELTFLDSIASISALAIKNANLYKKIYEKASTDHLTELLNREFFFTEMEKVFNKKPESLILAIMNIDDFSLYNELYGRNQGDIALRNIAKIIKSSLVDQETLIARYGGKEFSIVFVDSDIMSVKRKMNLILNQIHTQNQLDSSDWKKDITMSIGLCIYPYAASSMQELVSNTEMAVFNAKQHGKNRINVYTMEEIILQDNQPNEFNNDVYAQYEPTISALTAAIDVKDHYTFHHSTNVAQYASILAKALGLNHEHVELIKEAALLHDIGKIGIPEDILNKPGKLTEKEYAVVKSHVENSISIIRHLPSLDYLIPAVLGHHERWDGLGYPRGLKREENPIAARCIGVADTFDAMTTKRSYRDPIPLPIVIEEIKQGANTQFDPKLANLFVELIENGQIVVPEAY